MSKNTNPFDSIATPKSESKKKSTKITAEINDEVKKAAGEVIKLKAEITSLKAKQEEKESLIISHILPQQEKHAREGNFSKSFLVEYDNEKSLTLTTADVFSVPEDEESQEAIKKLLGKEFDTYFEYVRSITLKPEIQNDPKFIQKLAKVVSDAGMNLGDAFEVTDTLETKKDMDRKQYELPETKLNVLRTLISQRKASLK